MLVGRQDISAMSALTSGEDIITEHPLLYALGARKGSIGEQGASPKLDKDKELLN